MKKQYVYIGILIVGIILAVFLWDGADKEEESPISTTSTSTPITSQKPVPKSSNTTKSNTSIPTTKPASDANKTAISISAPKDIEGSAFRLTNYNGVAIPTDQKYTLSFEKGNLNAKFCNSLSGEYVLDKETNQMVVRNLLGTQMYCGEPANLMDMEQTFGSVMGRGVTISQYGNNLMLNDTKGNTFIYSGFAN